MASNPFGSITLPTQLFLSFALGHAASPAVEPFAQSLANDAWKTHAVRPPTTYTLAPMSARGKISETLAKEWNAEQGFADNVLSALEDGSLTGPDLADLFSMWRRGFIGQTRFETGLKNLGVMPDWWADLEQLFRVHLTPDQAANARQQQFISDQEQRDIAALFGITSGDADIQFELAGLPPGVETGLQMWRRGIIDQPTFDQIVAEGHTKTKYTGDLEQLKRQLLQPATAVRAHLKGHITSAEMHTRGAQWGFDPADMDLWYQSEGRPATAHQIHIGYMRGATLAGAANEQDAIDISVAQSDIRPEYADLIYAGRDTYPSLFQLNRLVAASAITPAIAADWATKSGVNHDVVLTLEQYWQGLGGGTGTSSHVTKAETRLWTTMQTSYISGEVQTADLGPGFTALGIAAADQTQITHLWDTARELERKQLTPTQIKKAVKEGVTNPATGAPWTQDEAVARLISMGYSANDAHTFLSL